MAKAVYIGNNNSKKVKKMYLGNGTSRKVKKGYIGVNNQAKLFFSGATVWKKYNAVENHTYHWNRFNRVTKTTYKWNRYTINNVTKYRYAKYKISKQYYLRFSAGSRLNLRGQDIGNTIYSQVSVSTNGTLQYSGGKTITASNYNSLERDFNFSDPQSSVSGGAFYRGVSLENLIRDYRYDPDTTGDMELIAKYSGTSIGTKTETTQGSFIEFVDVPTKQYPTNGISNGYWWVYDQQVTIKEQGSLVDQVTSTSSSAYPQNGISGNYWYVAAGSDVTYSKGAAAGEVTSSNRGAYPDNNYSGNYWYVFARDEITYTRGSYIQDVENDNPNAYPSNGRHSDGYWYVLQLE